VSAVVTARDRPPTHRSVFFVSDRTGITAEMLGNSLLSQFEQIEFQRRTIPFVDTPERIAEVVALINQTATAEKQRPVVFSSIVDEAMSAQLGLANALFLDLFQVFIAPLEAELDAKSSHTAGRSHGIANPMEYFARMEAVNFAQAHDDGAATRDLGKAQAMQLHRGRGGSRATCPEAARQRHEHGQHGSDEHRREDQMQDHGGLLSTSIGLSQVRRGRRASRCRWVAAPRLIRPAARSRPSVHRAPSC